VRWEKHLLTSHFLSNIFAKNYQHRFTYVKIIARQSSDIFETQCIIYNKVRGGTKHESQTDHAAHYHLKHLLDTKLTLGYMTGNKNSL